MKNPPEQRFPIAALFFIPDASRGSRRLRAGWRLLAHALLFALLALFIGGGIGVVLLLNRRTDLLANQLINQGVFLLCVTLATYLARRWVDRRTFTSLGLDWNGQARRDLLAGFFIPAGIMGVIFLVEWRLGWLELRGFAWEFGPVSLIARTVPVMFLTFILIGWSEELLGRGYWLQNLAEGVNLPFGVAASSLLFGLLHAVNPHASWMAVAGVTLAGLFLAYAYLRTRQLWLPIGLHTGWNFFENTVFGFPVSGLNMLGVLVHVDTGPAWLTGGAFGPEGGLIIVPGMLLGAALVYAYTRGRLASS